MMDDRGSGTDTSGARVLIVGSDPPELRNLAELLRVHNYQAEIAADAQAAIRQLDRHEFSAVLLDLHLLAPNEPDVFRNIIAAGADSIVIVIGDASSIPRAVRALKQGAYDFLQKPHVPEQLLKTLANAIRQQRLEAENAATRERLARSEQLRHDIIEGSPDLIYMLDTAGCFTFVNKRMASLLRYDFDDLIGKHYSAIVHEDDLEFARGSFNERRTGERAAQHIELRLKRGHETAGALGPSAPALTVELSAVGMYASENGHGRRRFQGTYGSARDISAHKRAEEIINFQASHDLLTRLPNRFLFKDRLGLALRQARRNGPSFAIMFLDLDRFKLVNDTFGHLIGDELLQAISKRIQRHLRMGDTLARAGGDEYMMLLPQAGQHEAAREIARKILHEMRRVFVIEGHELEVTVSIGIALYPEHGESEDALIRHADLAMYQVKDNGKNNFAFYHAAIKTTPPRHLALEADLHHALRADQFVMSYQPQVDTTNGAIVGMHASICWRHPTRGEFSAAEFLPLAEDAGLITAIGEWMLATGCRDMRRWREAGLPDVRLVVTVYAPQFEQDGLIETIMAALKENALPPEVLEIEITENAIMQDMAATVRKLRELAGHGIRIAIDNFGTGYASLSYLRRLPVNTLKVGGLFVQDIVAHGEQASVTTAILAMTQSLSIDLIVSGVETEEQMNALRACGCHLFQGHFLSAPVTGEQARTMLLKQPFADLGS